MKRLQPTLLIGTFIITIILIVAIFAPLLTPDNYQAQNLSEQLRPPSNQHLLGQDQFGSDVLGYLIMGSRLSLTIGFLAVLLSLIVGSMVGAVAGYYGGWLDTLIMRIVDIFMAFPGFLLAIAIAAVLGPGIFNVVFALSIVSWVTYARLVRGQFLSLKERDFVTAARSLGVKPRVIIFKHILPLCISPLIVHTTFALAGAILIEASLSFLGLGAPADVPSWGRMLSSGARYILQTSHLAMFPGLAIMLTVLSLNFIGDGLRDLLDVEDSKAVKLGGQS